MTEPAEPLYVVELWAENVMGVRAADIKIGEGGIIVSGSNGAGKSSFLGLLAILLGGAKAEPRVPIREGAFRAECGTILGRDGTVAYTIEKEFEAGVETRLVVTDAKGARVAKPQDVLSRLYSDLTLDVGAFISPAGEKTEAGKSKRQVEMLLQACPLDVDLDKLAVERKRAYDDRADAKKDADRITGELRLTAKRDAPAHVDLVAKQSELRAAFAKREARNADTTRVAAIDKRMAEIREEFKRLDEDRKGVVLRISSDGDLPNTAELEAEITAGVTTNENRTAILRDNARYDELLGQLGAKKGKEREFDAAIEAIDKKKVDALARANFPVAGLGLDEVLGVTFAQDGKVLPYGQLNMAKRAEIAVAVCAALAPTLRCARVDGNLFDPETLEAVWRAARVRGLQLLIERISADMPGAIVFRKGEVDRIVPDAPAVAS